MKIAYLVFAYKNPQVLGKLVEALSSEESAFFIHIDLKSNLDDYVCIKGQNVVFIEPRHRVYWAEFSGVHAILSLMSQALQRPEKYDYLFLLSGSEYPLVSRQELHAFCEANRGAEFMNLVAVPNQDAGKTLTRFNTLRLPSHRPVSRLLVRAMAKFGLAQRDHRKYLGGLTPYAGATWWALTRHACEYILKFEKENSKFVKFFENSFAPEESFMHTILGNSPFGARVRRSVLYEDWSARGAHPAMINEAHLAVFESQEKVMANDIYGCGELLFARKFCDEGIEMIRKVDEMIMSKERKRSISVHTS